MVPPRERARFVLTGLAVTCVTGCGIVFGLESLEYSASPDASVEGDGGVQGTDAPADSRAIPDGEAPFDLRLRWTSFKPPGTDGAQYQAGPFDGRFAYFLLTAGNSVPGALVRYDTEAPFEASSSWSTFLLGSVADVAVQRSLAFDGRYLTLPGVRALEGGATGVAIRFDTQRPAEFTSAAAWETFDTRPITEAGVGHVAAASLDGGVYFGASTNTTPNLHRAGEPAFGAGWERVTGYSTCTAPAGLSAVAGAGCAGSFLYFVGACAVRYDLRQPFSDPAAWVSLPLVDLGLDHTGYTGTVTTPSHVYASQSSFTDGGDGKFRIAQISPTDQLDAGFAFREVARTNPLATGTLGGTFDGRFVYFAPVPRGNPSPGTVYLRYDTEKSFGDDSAWSSVTGASLGFGVYSHRGAVFDGMYVYYGTSAANVPIVRYRATATKRVIAQPCATF